MQANYVQRLRLEFAKVGPTRFIGHLDLARALERSLNRGQIPLAYTQGFNPRPRMQLAAALPLGFTSECEMADIWLLETLEPGAVYHALAPKMAPGIDLKRVTEVELGGPALQNVVCEAIYVVAVPEAPARQKAAQAIDRFMTAESIMRERRGKTYDLRPLVHEITITSGADPEQCADGNAGGELELTMRLSMLPGKTGRPDELLEALDLDPYSARIHRQRLILAYE